MEWVKYGEIREQAERYCAFCGGVVDEEEVVLANTELLPTPWLCSECVRVIKEVEME